MNFYPEVINQRELIEEAIALNGFIGFQVLYNNIPVGFSWGFQIPQDRTRSVNFPIIVPLLKEKGINPEKTFYGAETGVREEYQDRKIGSVLVSKRSLAAFEEGYSYFTFRTINPKMIRIISNLFSDKFPLELFKDPETGSPWFSWNFEDFNINTAKEKIGKLK
jgi:hypothetical protein